MGIPGIYKELGPGERTALSKLAVEHIEKTGRPLRIAIDISIWQFQIQSGQGGKNPAFRTLYYRLLRLLALSIQPILVFDGPHKPPFKRGSKTTSSAACLPNFLTKELLKCFGFPYHTAPGEAEAECALLQKEGLVDAVLSEDVDTLMFGCTLSLRNWTAEAVRSNKSPTHVNVYHTETTKSKTRLDSEGMILVALMSGGDYIPAGIPGCGIKTACEAARAGFGKDLCQLSRNDHDGLRQWRKRLERELWTNESKLFRQRHKAMTIPESFPSMTVLGYYTNPVVSSLEKVLRLRTEINWKSEMDVPGLRLFVSEAFDWQYLTGAKKFIRGLAPALLAHQCIRRSTSIHQDEESLRVKELAERTLVKAISSRRIHWCTDGTPELKIAYTPADIVGLDLSTEEEGDFQGYTNDVSGDEEPVSGADEDRGPSRSPTKKRRPLTYDPTEIEKTWVLETYVKLGVPLLVETWEEEMRNPKKFATRKVREKKALTKGHSKPGAMDQFVKITKAVSNREITREKPGSAEVNEQLPALLLAPATAKTSQSIFKTALSENRKPVAQKAKKKPARSSKVTEPRKEETSSASQLSSSSPVNININPWTLCKSPSDTFGFKSSTRYSALGIYPSDDSVSMENPLKEKTCNGKQQCLASPPASPSPRKRYSRPTTPISDNEDRQGPVHSQKTKTSLSALIRRDSAKQSPRKKRSPLQSANELYLAGQLLTTTIIRTEKQSEKLPLAWEEHSTSQKVNRKLDFTKSKIPPILASPSSDKSSLPSPSALLSPVAPEQVKDCSRYFTAPYKAPISRDKARPKKKLVALRQSLEGAWKHLEPWQTDMEGLYSSVEVLDLTDD